MLKELLKTSEYNLHCPAMWKDTQYVFMDVSWRCGNHSWLTFVPWCRYCSVSFQSLLFSHLAIALIHNTKKLPVFHSPLKPQYPPVFKFSKLISTWGGHWGILETAKPKKKIIQTRKKIWPKPKTAYKTVKNRYNGDKWGIQSKRY